MAHPSSYYKSALVGAQTLEWEEKKAELKKERKAHRALVGCSGCFHGKEVLAGGYICNKGYEPIPGTLFCSKWHDIRTGKSPKESGCHE